MVGFGGIGFCECRVLCLLDSIGFGQQRAGKHCVLQHELWWLQVQGHWVWWQQVHREPVAVGLAASASGRVVFHRQVVSLGKSFLTTNYLARLKY